MKLFLFPAAGEKIISCVIRIRRKNNWTFRILWGAKIKKMLLLKYNKHLLPAMGLYITGQ